MKRHPASGLVVLTEETLGQHNIITTRKQNTSYKNSTQINSNGHKMHNVMEDIFGNAFSSRAPGA